MAKMKCPENCGGACVAGVEYTADKKGFVNVPDQHIDVLVSHGYELVGPTDTEASQAKAEQNAQSEKAEQIAEAKAKVAELETIADAAMQAHTDNPTEETEKAQTEAIDAFNAASAELHALEG